MRMWHFSSQVLTTMAFVVSETKMLFARSGQREALNDCDFETIHPWTGALSFHFTGIYSRQDRVDLCHEKDEKGGGGRVGVHFRADNFDNKSFKSQIYTPTATPWSRFKVVANLTGPGPSTLAAENDDWLRMRFA